MLEKLSVFMALVGVLIGGVNIITEVLKAVFIKEETSKPLVVFIVSEIVCMITGYVYSILYTVKITPVIFLGALVGGFFLSYGAMYGYDKLYGGFLKGIEHFFIKEK